MSESRTAAAMSATTSADSLSNKRQKLDDIKPSVNASDKTDKTLVALSDSDVQRLVSQFECPVCLEHICPPVLQCPNGHVFCRPCRQKLTTPVRCPTCREPLPTKDIHSHQMELMAVNLRLPFQCKYSSFGCLVTTLLPDKLGPTKTNAITGRSTVPLLGVRANGWAVENKWSNT